jgi:hypothetical protein
MDKKTQIVIINLRDLLERIKQELTLISFSDDT